MVNTQYQLSLAYTIDQMPSYTVDEYGTVRSKRSGLPIKQHDSNGYQRVRLTYRGVAKNFRVHRLVAAAFIPNPDALPHVDHIDEDKNNNHVDNLKWITPKENTARSVSLHPERYENLKCIRIGLDSYEFHSRLAAAKWLAKRYSKKASQIYRELTRPQRKTIYGHKIVRL